MKIVNKVQCSQISMNFINTQCKCWKLLGNLRNASFILIAQVVSWKACAAVHQNENIQKNDDFLQPWVQHTSTVITLGSSQSNNSNHTWLSEHIYFEIHSYWTKTHPPNKNKSNPPVSTQENTTTVSTLLCNYLLPNIVIWDSHWQHKNNHQANDI